VLPYWLLFCIPAFASLFERPYYAQRRHAGMGLVALNALIICIFVGLRYEVGSDWRSYWAQFVRVSVMPISKIPAAGDPGYVLLNWLAGRLGADIWLVNLVSAAVFSWGLFSFVKHQSRPWLSLAIAIPYLVIVVGMGYTRQGVAIGLAMRGFVALKEGGSNLRFVLWVIAAATFHKSATLLIPMVALIEQRGRLWTVLWVAGATILIYFTLLESSVDRLVYTYLEREYDSGGTAVRVAMNVVPALLLLMFRERFVMRRFEKRLWMTMAWIALALIPAFMLSPSSTAVDRTALYILPLQIVVLSHVPDAFARSRQTAQFLNLVIILYSASIQFVWLNYASHAGDWLPYRVYPF
jgi:hypothetical protein